MPVATSRARRGPRLITMGAIAVAALVGARGARAEVFRYVDRDGLVHEVNVPPDASSALAAPAPAVAPPSLADLPYAGHVAEAAQLYSLPVELVFAVMRIESGFDKKAVSIAGALGLMQLMPATAAELGVVDPFDPRQNILGGARFLRILLNEFGGDLVLALAAYNAGADAVRQYSGIPPYPETRKYVTDVLTVHRRYARRAAGARPAR